MHLVQLIPLADLFLFSQTQPEFEGVFRTYGEDVKFNYLRSFGRVSVTYPSPEQAELAQSNLNNLEFQGASLKMRPVKVRLY